MSLRVLLSICFIGLTSVDSPAADNILPATATSFLKAECFDCHSGSDAEAALDLQQLSPDLSRRTNFAKWVRIFDRVAAGEMPPQDSATVAPDKSSEFLRATGQWLKRTNETKTRLWGACELGV